MSLKDVVEKAVGIEAADPEQARRDMLHRLDRTRQAFMDQQESALGSGWITRAEAGRVAFTPTRPDGQPLVIGGQSVNFWEESDVPAVLDAFARAISSGELDPQLVGSTPAGQAFPTMR